MNKYLDLVQPNKPIDNIQIENVLQLLNSKNKSFKSTYLVQKRDELIPIKTEDIAYFFIEEGIVKVVTFRNNSFVINKKLEDIEQEIDNQIFFRVNRQMITNRNAISNIKYICVLLIKNMFSRAYLIFKTYIFSVFKNH